MIAVAALSAGWQAVLFGIATLLFVIAGVFGVDAVTNDPATRRVVLGLRLVPLGLAFATFVFFWQALSLS
jgi:hypothetical protein